MFVQILGKAGRTGLDEPRFIRGSMWETMGKEPAGTGGQGWWVSNLWCIGVGHKEGLGLATVQRQMCKAVGGFANQSHKSAAKGILWHRGQASLRLPAAFRHWWAAAPRHLNLVQMQSSAAGLLNPDAFKDLPGTSLCLPWLTTPCFWLLILSQLLGN